MFPRKTTDNSTTLQSRCEQTLARSLMILVIAASTATRNRCAATSLRSASQRLARVSLSNRLDQPMMEGQGHSDRFDTTCSLDVVQDL